MKYVINDPSLETKDLGSFCAGWKEPLTEEILFRALKGSYRYVIARDGDGTVAGFVSAISDGVFAAFIPMLEVRPQYQGKGTGTALMEHLLAELSGMRIVDLMCDPALQAFYKRLGMYPMSGMRASSRGESQGGRTRFS
jgi:ribosomal protein S18 acetylase RimI-like enzyme